MTVRGTRQELQALADKLGGRLVFSGRIVFDHCDESGEQNKDVEVELDGERPRRY